MTQPCGMPVTQFHVSKKMTVNGLVKAMGKAGVYNGGSLARAADIWEQMLQGKETTKFFGLAGAMVPAGIRIIIDPDSGSLVAGEYNGIHTFLAPR